MGHPPGGPFFLNHVLALNVLLTVPGAYLTNKPDFLQFGTIALKRPSKLLYP